MEDHKLVRREEWPAGSRGRFSARLHSWITVIIVVALQSQSRISILVFLKVLVVPLVLSLKRSPQWPKRVNSCRNSMADKRDTPDKETATHNNIAKRAAFGTVATLLLRLVSFACTQWTFRVLDPATIGRTSIQLELLHTTAIFLSREGFRLSLTRQFEDNWNVAWLTVPVATTVSALALVWHVSSASATEDVDYRTAGILYCTASCLEGWAEPAVLSALRQMNLSLKASAEGLATVAKTLATVIFLQYLRDDWPATAFGLAQIVYSLVYAAVLYSSVPLVGPRWSQGLDRRTCYMTVVFTLQGLFKHMLTEGDRIVLSTVSSSYDQGVYALGTAYGGLAARVILQPIEESSRLLWSRQSVQLPPDAGLRTIVHENDDPLMQSYTVLVKLVLYVGFIFGFMATNYTSVLLGVLAGRKWGDNQEAAAVLSAFCVYTAFLALNGITEAFVYGVASTASDMGRLGVAHTVIGCIFALIAPVAISRYGTVGLVAANCLAMLFRSMYSVRFAAVYFSTRWQENRNSPTFRILWRLIRRVFPDSLVIACFVACYLGTKTSLARFERQVAEQEIPTGSTAWLRLAAEHVGLGSSLGIGLLTTAYWVEGDFRKRINILWRGGRAS